MLSIQETLVAFSDLPGWCQQNLGRRISPSTLHRWRLRGCRGIKLETILIGGTRMTSAEALQRFFDATTSAQDGSQLANAARRADTASHQSAVEYLENEGAN